MFLKLARRLLVVFFGWCCGFKVLTAPPDSWWMDVTRRCSPTHSQEEKNVWRRNLVMFLMHRAYWLKALNMRAMKHCIILRLMALLLPLSLEPTLESKHKLLLLQCKKCCTSFLSFSSCVFFISSIVWPPLPCLPSKHSHGHAHLLRFHTDNNSAICCPLQTYQHALNAALSAPPTLAPLLPAQSKPWI